jgi:orotate phosphoribosyltransferase
MNAEKIAETSLKIGSIKLRPANPFKWASGYRMPIYNDNRMLLGSYEHRMLVATSLASIIKENNLEFDYIAGIPTAGIAPAASLAQVMNKPLIIYDNGEFIESYGNFSQFDFLDDDFDVIASTCPYAISAGVEFANNKKKPFIYVRQSQKDHGMERKIEGVLSKDQTALLIDLFFNPQNSYADSAVDTIYNVTNAQVDVVKGLVIKNEVDVKGKKLLVLEDLISTGSSSIKEIIKYREQGAIVDNLLSIFNYGFPEVTKNFEDENLIVNSALYYDTMLNVAKEKGCITDKQQNLLADWRIDPFNWGEKNGFPQGSSPLK